MSIFGLCQMVLDRTKYQVPFGLDQMFYGRFGQDQTSANQTNNQIQKWAWIFPEKIQEWPIAHKKMLSITNH